MNCGRIVEKCAGLCYNRDMEEVFPGFGKYEEWMKEYSARFGLFRALLLEYNARFNLTSITEERDMYYKHFLDSICGEWLFPQGASVCEIGSGAGFPSLPLKIVRGDLRFTLVESTGKKCEFLKAAIKELALSDTEVVCARAEDLGKNPFFREKYDVVCARAVAAMNTLCEYCLPLVRVGGDMIAYKGECGEEMLSSEHAVRVLGGGDVTVTSYELPECYGTRSLVRIKKKKRTPAGYPRGNGKERKEPII